MGEGAYELGYGWLPGPHVGPELDWDAFSQHIPKLSLLKENLLVT